MEPRSNDLQYNDIPGITFNNLLPTQQKLQYKMYGAEPRYNDIPGLTISFYCSVGISLNWGSTVKRCLHDTGSIFILVGLHPGSILSTYIRLHGTGSSFIPVRLHPGSILSICIRLHDTSLNFILVRVIPK